MFPTCFRPTPGQPFLPATTFQDLQHHHRPCVHRFKMVLISSKTLIQAHAVILMVIAGYLIKNPELITDSDVVFMMGEALRVV